MMFRKSAGCFLAALTSLLAGPAGADEAVMGLVRAYNETGQDLFNRLSQAPGNLVLSPYSVGTAMAMARSGARGGTEAEMARVLHHKGDRAALERAHPALTIVLRAQEGQAPGGKADGAPQLIVANALMVSQAGDGTVAKSYADLLGRAYGAKVFRNADLAAVNDWAARETAGQIKPLLTKLSGRASAVLLSAVAFRGAWETPFPKAATTPKPFHLAGAATVDVPTMVLSGDLAVIKDPGYRALALPFAGSRFAMAILLPDEAAALPSPSAREAADLITRLGKAERQRVSVALPRFRGSFGTDLVAAFKASGLHLAFDDSKADFSGISGKLVSPPLYVGSIVHKAGIEVDEAGALATAATAVVLETRSARIGPQTSFVVDRPFLFLIAELGTGAILFQGRISDPRGNAKAE